MFLYLVKASTAPLPTTECSPCPISMAALVLESCIGFGPKAAICGGTRSFTVVQKSNYCCLLPGCCCKLRCGQASPPGSCTGTDKLIAWVGRVRFTVFRGREWGVRQKDLGGKCVCWILSPIFHLTAPPFSLHMCASYIAGIGPNKPVGHHRAYLNSPSVQPHQQGKPAQSYFDGMSLRGVRERENERLRFSLLFAFMFLIEFYVLICLECPYVWGKCRVQIR